MSLSIQQAPLVGLGGRKQLRREATLADMFALIGFDPAAVGSDYLMILGDPHIDGARGQSGGFPIEVETEILANAANPPAYIVSMGDTISDYLLGYDGDHPTPVTGTAEFGYVQTAFDTISAVAPVRMVTGNHDNAPSGHPSVEPGTFMASKVTHMELGYRSEILGGMRVAWLNMHVGSRIPDEQQAAWLADLAAVPDGDEMLTFVHHDALTVALDHGMSDLYGMVPVDFDRTIWTICGHHHYFLERYRKFADADLKVKSWSVSGSRTGGGVDDTAPCLTVVCLRGGRLVARLAKPCLFGYWYLLADYNTSAPTNMLRLLNPLVLGVTTIASYMEGAYTRQFEDGSGSTTWFNYDSSLLAVKNLTARFPVPPTAQGLWIATNRTGLTVEVSSDNATWETLTMVNSGDYALKSLLSVGILAEPNIFIRLTSAGAAYVRGWGFY